VIPEKVNTPAADELLAAISILEVLPTIQQKTEFADRAIKTVIHLDKSGFCVKGYIPTSSIDTACSNCNVLNETGPDEQFVCPLHTRLNIRLIPIDTSESFFGYFIVFGDSIDRFIQFETILLNFLTIFSIAIDNLQKSLSLEILNLSLHKSEVLYHSLFDKMLNGFAYCKMLFDDGVPKDFIYLNVNSVFESLTGLKDVTGKKVSEIIPGFEKSDSELLARYANVALTGIPETFEVYVIALEMWFSISIYSPEKEFFVAVFDVITSRKKADADILSRNKQLQEMNAEKDKFFSIIAHDLRAPFNGFLGLTKIMAEELPSMTLEEIQKVALHMRKSATNLFYLIENLLEWSLLQRGIINYNPEQFSLVPKIFESLRPAMDAALKKGIEFIYEVHEDLDVWADIQMIQTIIRNLASNAVKYTPAGGRVSLSVSKTEHNDIEVSMRDTGIGLSDEMIAKLFNLNENINRKGTEGEPSTGLGLIICKELVDKHGGTIRAESEVGNGSLFSFTIPSKELPSSQQ